MAMLTSQKIIDYYDKYKSIEVTFSKEVAQVTGLMTQQIHLKCGSDVWPCVIFSSSFEGAKIVSNIKTGLLQKLESVNQMTSLRFCFRLPEAANPLAFFVNSKVQGYSPYGDSLDAAMFTLQFTQRPPDDLIEIIGRILDANVNSVKRKDERITIADDTVRRLSLVSKECAAFIQGVPRRCIMRDISFSGARLIMVGVPKFLADKEVSLRIDFNDPRESFLLKGKSAEAVPVEGRKDLVVLDIEYEETAVPMGYKMRLNDYLGQVRVGDQRYSEMSAQKAPPKATADAKPPDDQKEEASEAASASGETNPGEASSGETNPKETAPKEANPKEAAPKVTNPKEAIPKGANHGDKKA